VTWKWCALPLQPSPYLRNDLTSLRPWYFIFLLSLGLAQARDLVSRSTGVERTRELARSHADKAKQLLETLPDSEAKNALGVLAELVVKRSW
jgi:hypothetical protein